MVLFMAGNVGVAVFERLGIKPFVQRRNELRIFAGKMKADSTPKCNRQHPDIKKVS